MKNPLLFCLVVWLVLLSLPYTRGQVLLDWRAATVQQLSGSNPAWAPLDSPYRPETEIFSYTGEPTEEGLPIPVAVNGLKVAPQFVSVARSSSDRDVLVWCALSAKDSDVIASNLQVLEKRFPGDAELLAWSCDARVQKLSMTTRVPGPLSSPFPAWSVQIKPVTNSGQEYNISPEPRWNAVVKGARKGQKREPQNSFWWWLETMALLGARRDEEVWATLRAGSLKATFNDHTTDKVLSLRRAHLKTLGQVPTTFFLGNRAESYRLYSRWREATRQVCENVMGARLAGRHKMALEGGRDMLLMGRQLRLSGDDLSVLVGSAIEQITMRNAAVPVASNFKRLPRNPNVQVLAGHPSSLLRYASELNRQDIAAQVTKEWKAVVKAQATQVAKMKACLVGASTHIEGVKDSTLTLAVGSQNIGLTLVQTLSAPLIALALLSLLLVRVHQREQTFALPNWTRGLGWSAFALLVIVAAQILFGQLARSALGISYWGFDLILPRLAFLLPLWAFGFAACVVAIGAVWSTMFSSRRARGDASFLAQLRSMFNSPDERTGTLNLGPLLQLIAVVGVWGMIIILLGAWFFFPQNGALENQGSETLHDQYAGLALALFCLAGSLPALEFRVRGTKFRTYLMAWAEVTRRFLVAHLVLTTILYLLLSLNGSYWGKRLDAEWLQANKPQTASSQN